MLDSHRPTIDLKTYAYREVRYNVLGRMNPPEAERLMKLAQERLKLTWNTYEEMASRDANGADAANA